MQLLRCRAPDFNFVYHEHFQFIMLSPSAEINLNVGEHHRRAYTEQISTTRSVAQSVTKVALWRRPVLNPEQINPCAC